MSQFASWGNYPNRPQSIKSLSGRFDALPKLDESTLLPYGNARSYGDSCLNSDGVLLSSAALNHFIAFDPATGVLKAEAGVTLEAIIQLVLPHGWFLPVTPGTRFVTLGGAIANDVHGKNHHLAASFGNHVNAFELVRTDGQRFECSESSNSDWFYATIGGLGLTGFISWAEIQLKPVKSSNMQVESIKYDNLNQFFELAESSEAQFEYTAVWLDCLAQGESLGRGHFIRGNHAESGLPAIGENVFAKSPLTFPITPPISCINNLSVSVFNQLYYHRQKEQKKVFDQDFTPFFYPLDGILHWNRMYGRKGFVQYQCVIPMSASPDVIKELLEKIARSKMGSFLVVLKTMGDVASKGMLSFSRSGTTLAMDFPFQGEKTLRFLASLDETVRQSGGAIYPAKDARMPADLFEQGYPQLDAFKAFKDENINSDFWRRLTE